ncbi:hypothetical protein G3I77_31025 [Streptomyces sp. D2-8]|nr:hypothetical protein [Streptomyces sp. D2-8]MCK8437275.1 hypothetical protein [Streptomyces sp. D2-8]
MTGAGEAAARPSARAAATRPVPWRPGTALGRRTDAGPLPREDGHGR